MNIPDDAASLFRDRGYFLVPQLFRAGELVDLADHVFTVRQPPESERSRYPMYPFTGFPGTRSLAELDMGELQRIERLMRLHQFDLATRRLMLDSRLGAVVRTIWSGEPLAVHSAYFPKPPGGRGICVHSDNFYFQAQPAEIAACLVAIDDADAQNGALQVAAGTHRVAHAAPHRITTEESISPEEFALPSGAELTLVPMNAGDVLVFHGNLLHASAPNRSQDRWRRAFIFHYVSGAQVSLSHDCQPPLRFGPAGIDPA